ncbi:MAG: YitT family protein [Treponema sp.]|nr:YitT family protein [Treponema sp.]
MSKPPIHSAYKIPHPAVRFLLICLGAVLMSVNLNTFVHSAGLLPGGFTGVVLLLQEVFLRFFGIHIPFSALLWTMNAIPAAISFKLIGKNFTLYSCLMIVISGFLTDLLPSFPVTGDLLLCAVFGGIVNGIAVSLCLSADATSGGTDFIAILISERTGRNAFNAILAGNVIVLLVAALLFSWDRALYSIIFQYSSTQIVNFLYRRYAKTTMLVITEKSDEAYQIIRDVGKHDATLFVGTGCYTGKPKKMLYSVLSGEESQMIATEIRRIDPGAFINILQSKQILGRFFRRPTN